MEVDPTDDNNASAMKWPGKRGGRGPKESIWVTLNNFLSSNLSIMDEIDAALNASLN